MLVFPGLLLAFVHILNYFTYNQHTHTICSLPLLFCLTFHHQLLHMLIRLCFASEEYK